MAGGAVPCTTVCVADPDPDPVAPQRRECLDRGLLDGEGREDAFVIGLEPGLERVDAGGLQPLLRPLTQLASGRGLELGQQVGVPTPLNRAVADILALYAEGRRP